MFKQLGLPLQRGFDDLAAAAEQGEPASALSRRRRRSPRLPAIFPNEAAITRRIGAILLEQNDEWAVQRSSYLTLESVAPVGDDPLVCLPATAA